MLKSFTRVAVIAASAFFVAAGTMGVASAATTSATFAGFGSGPTEDFASNAALVNAQNQATSAGYNVSTQCLQIGRSEEYNGTTAFVEIDLGCGPAYATVVPNIVGLSRTGASSALQAAGLFLGSETDKTIITCDDPVNTVLAQAVAAGTTVKPGLSVNYTYGVLPSGGLHCA